MTNLKKSFEDRAATLGDKLVSVVVGEDDRKRDWSARPKNHPVQPWDEGSKGIDYAYDSGFGGADCHAVIAWGERFVYFVHEYDGATGIYAMPRNPMECNPGWADVDIIQ